MCHVLLQRRKDEAGGVARVRRPSRATVVEAVCQSLRKNARPKSQRRLDREAIDRFVERIVISPKSIEIHCENAVPSSIQASHSALTMRRMLVRFLRPLRSAPRGRCALTHGLGDGVLNGADAHAGLGGDPTDREIANP